MSSPGTASAAKDRPSLSPASRTTYSPVFAAVVAAIVTSPDRRWNGELRTVQPMIAAAQQGDGVPAAGAVPGHQVVAGQAVAEVAVVVERERDRHRGQHDRGDPREVHQHDREQHPEHRQHGDDREHREQRPAQPPAARGARVRPNVHIGQWRRRRARRPRRGARPQRRGRQQRLRVGALVVLARRRPVATTSTRAAPSSRDAERLEHARPRAAGAAPATASGW